MENTVVKEGEVYGVLRCNWINTEMSYPLMLPKGTIKLWMREIEGYTVKMVNEAIRFLNP
jgi:hypothetical protein